MSSNNFDRPNVLVAGGAGFLGSNLCEQLLGEYNVICVDNYSTGHESNIDELLSNPHFEFIQHDIRTPFDFSAHTGVEKFRIRHVGFQFIVDATGAGSHTALLKDQIGTLMAASEGTKQLLELAVSSHARFVLLSDALVYGDAEGLELSEDMRGTLHSTPHVNRAAEAKRFAEELVSNYAELYSLPTVVIRLGVVYGMRMHLGDGKIVSTLIEQGFHGETVALPNGLQTLQALFISDACDALKNVLAGDATGTYNLAGATRYDLRGIAEAIVSRLESHSEIKEAPITKENEDEFSFWIAQARPLSIARIKDTFGWFPVVRIEDGLAQTIDYMKALRGVRRVDV